MADSAPSSPKRFWPDVLGGEELLEGLGGVEPLEDVALVVEVELGRHALDLLLDPALLLRVLDVHVLDADRAAVGVAQHVEDVAERHALAPAEAAGEELAVEVPDREPVGGRVELDRHVGLLPAERVEVGDQVAAHAVDADEVGDRHLLLEHRLLAVDGVDVAPPLHGLVGHAEGAEHLVVEAVGAEQQLLDPLEEQARLGALDDPVVVGGADRDDLRHAEVGERDRVGGLPLRGVVEAADADDEALAGHEARHRLLRADRARVGEAHGGAGEVVGAELVRAHLADELLVGAPEAAEVERVGVARRPARAACGCRRSSPCRPRCRGSRARGGSTRGLPSASST